MLKANLVHVTWFLQGSSVSLRCSSLAPQGDVLTDSDAREKQALDMEGIG